MKLINDAAMQALGSYKNGKMLFLGFGTGLGSAMVVDARLFASTGSRWSPSPSDILPYKALAAPIHRLKTTSASGVSTVLASTGGGRKSRMLWRTLSPPWSLKIPSSAAAI